MLTFNVKTGDFVGLFGIFSSGTNPAMSISELRAFAGTRQIHPGQGRGYRRLVAMRQEQRIGQWG
jgi:hypothetical protein